MGKHFLERERLELIIVAEGNESVKRQGYILLSRISKRTNSTSKNNLVAHLSLGTGTKQPCVSAGEAAVKSLPVEDQGCLIGMLAVHLQKSRAPRGHSGIKANSDTTVHSTGLQSVPSNHKCLLSSVVKLGKFVSLQVPCSLCLSTCSMPSFFPTRSRETLSFKSSS